MLLSAPPWLFPASHLRRGLTCKGQGEAKAEPTLWDVGTTQRRRYLGRTSLAGTQSPGLRVGTSCLFSFHILSSGGSLKGTACLRKLGSSFSSLCFVPGSPGSA